MKSNNHPRGSLLAYDYFLMFCSLNKLTWHHGAIPADEVWVKIGGDKGRSSS